MSEVSICPECNGLDGHDSQCTAGHLPSCDCAECLELREKGRQAFAAKALGTPHVGAYLPCQRCNDTGWVDDDDPRTCRRCPNGCQAPARRRRRAGAVPRVRRGGNVPEPGAMAGSVPPDPPASPYLVTIRNRAGQTITADLYDVLAAFETWHLGAATAPADHAVKKLLMAGRRGGGKSVRQDLAEARLAVERAVELCETTKGE